MNMMPVALYADREKAKAIQKYLVEAGFNAVINEKPPLTNFWFVSRGKSATRVEVPNEQFDRAETFLLEIDAGEDALSGAVRCPECESLRVKYPQYAEHSLLTNLAMGVLAHLRVIDKYYYCEDCHFAWPKEGYLARRNRPHCAPLYFIEEVEQTRLAPRVNESHKNDQPKAA